MTTAPAGSAKEGELRQRAAAASSRTPTTTKAETTTTRRLDAQASSITLLDLARIATGILLLSTLASYFTTSGQSYTWHLLDPTKRPWFLSPAGIRTHFAGPIRLTNAELASYDGTNGKPIYLALNRTIYDVSASPHVYGPGGPYSQLAAKDASRSYVTTCFDPAEDLVPYLSGVEEIHVPLWLSKTATSADVDASAPGEVMGGLKTSDLMATIKDKIGRKKMRILTEETYETARGKVRATIENWESMFAKKGYPVVGTVVGVDEGDVAKWKHLGFCEAAVKQRPAMTESMGRAMELMGRDPSKINLEKAFGGVGKAAGKAKDETKKGDKKDKKDKKDGKDGGDAKNARVEDLLAGGKYAAQDKVKEMLKSGPMGGSAKKADEAVEALRKDKGSKKLKVPDAVPEAVKADL